MLLYNDGEYEIHQLVSWMFQANCYIIKHKTNFCIIDPSGDPNTISEYLTHLGCHSLLMIATHCHFDHIAAADELIEATFTEELIVPPGEEDELRKAGTYSLLLCKQKLVPPRQICVLNDYLKKQLLEVGLHVLSTPGHTPGSVVFSTLNRKHIFSGDTIINNRYTKHASPPVSEDTDNLGLSLVMLRSHFDSNCLIFPGHGKLTTLGVELRFNLKIQNLVNLIDNSESM